MQVSSYPGRSSLCLNCTLQGLGICNDVFWSFPRLLICQRTTDITEYGDGHSSRMQPSPESLLYSLACSINCTHCVGAGPLWFSSHVSSCALLCLSQPTKQRGSLYTTSSSNSPSALCPVTGSYTVNRTGSFPLRSFRSFDVSSEMLHVLSVSSCQCLYQCWGSSSVCACTAGLRGYLTQRKWLMTGLTELCMCSFCQWHQDDHHITGQHSYPCFKETVCLWCLYCIPSMIV